MFVAFLSAAFTIKRQGGLLCSQPMLQVENWGARMAVMKGRFALAASLAACWHNGALTGSDGGIPAESDYSRCYKPLSPPHAGPITNSLFLAFRLPSRVVLFPSVTVSQTTFKLSNCKQRKVNVCLLLCIYQLILTNFTVSVVFLNRIVFGEAYPSHPFDAFRRGKGCNLRNIKHTRSLYFL